MRILNALPSTQNVLTATGRKICIRRCGASGKALTVSIPCRACAWVTPRGWIHPQTSVQTGRWHGRLCDQRCVHDGGAAFAIRVTPSCHTRMFSERVIGARFVQTAWGHNVGMCILNLIAERSQPNCRHVTADGVDLEWTTRCLHFNAWDGYYTPAYA